MSGIAFRLISGMVVGGSIFSGCYVKLHTPMLSDDQKGTFLNRMKEAATAALSPPTHHEYTRNHHFATVSSLASKEWTDRQDQSYKSINAVSGNTFRKIPVLVKSGEQYSYGGNTPHVTSSEARMAIISGRYVRCEARASFSPNQTPVQNHSPHEQTLMRIGGGRPKHVESSKKEDSSPSAEMEKLLLPQYVQNGDVILTGTEDVKDCDCLAKVFPAYQQSRLNTADQGV